MAVDGKRDSWARIVYSGERFAQRYRGDKSNPCPVFHSRHDGHPGATTADGRYAELSARGQATTVTSSSITPPRYPWLVYRLPVYGDEPQERANPWNIP